MSSLNPAGHSNSTAPENSRPQHPSPPHQPRHYPQPSHQQQQRSLQNPTMFEMQRGSILGPSTAKSFMLPRINGPEEELEVIGSGIPGSFEPHPAKSRLSMKLPNLKYNYPEASEQNYSPGTSLIFNAYRGHRGLLTQPYMAMIESPNYDGEQRRQSLQPPCQHQDPMSYALHHQERPMEHPSFRSPHERQFHPYQGNQDSTAYRDYRDSRNLQEYRDPRDHGSGPGQRSPSVTPSPAPPMSGMADPSPQQLRQNRDPYQPHDNYLRPRLPLESIPLNAGYTIAPSRHTPPISQQWRSPNADPSISHLSYEGSNSSDRLHPLQPQPAQRQAEDLWETPDGRQPYPTAAIDIPQPRRRGPPGYSPEEGGMRSQSQYAESRIPRESAESGPRGPFSPKAHGPRYELTRVQYRMIFEYASEIRECLIKGKVGTTDRLLYNAEILSKVFMGCRKDVDPNAPAEEETAINPHQLRCTSCNSVKTPEWRKGPLGPRTLCNACGLIWGKMSRSKAALALAKRKEESGTKSDAPAETFATRDRYMAGASQYPRDHEDAEQLLEPAASMVLDGSRKRGRDISTPDADDAEASARDEDRKAIMESIQEAEALHFAGAYQSGSRDVDLRDDVMQLPGKSETKVDHTNQTSTSEAIAIEDSMGWGGRGVSPSSAPGPSLTSDAPLTGDQDGHYPDDLSAGRKLALSFLMG